jgi:hypothetical protein
VQKSHGPFPLLEGTKITKNLQIVKKVTKSAKKKKPMPLQE